MSTEFLRNPQIRIESNGLPYDVKATHIESGVDLTPCLRGIKWELEAGEIAKVSLTFDAVGVAVSVDLQGQLEELNLAVNGDEAPPLGEMWKPERCPHCERLIG